MIILSGNVAWNEIVIQLRESVASLFHFEPRNHPRVVVRLCTLCVISFWIFRDLLLAYLLMLIWYVERDTCINKIEAI